MYGTSGAPFRLVKVPLQEQLQSISLLNLFVIARQIRHSNDTCFFLTKLIASIVGYEVSEETVHDNDLPITFLFKKPAIQCCLQTGF
jgi:hypothetical protein